MPSKESVFPSYRLFTHTEGLEQIQWHDAGVETIEIKDGEKSKEVSVRVLRAPNFRTWYIDTKTNLLVKEEYYDQSYNLVGGQVYLEYAEFENQDPAIGKTYYPTRIKNLSQNSNREYSINNVAFDMKINKGNVFSNPEPLINISDGKLLPKYLSDVKDRETRSVK